MVTFRLPSARLVASPATRAGIFAASATVAATFARGLLPRSVGDQALATAIGSAVSYQETVSVQAVAETLALFWTEDRSMRGREPNIEAVLAADLGLAATGIVIDRLLPIRDGEPLAASISRYVAGVLMTGGTVGGFVTAMDDTLRASITGRRAADRSLFIDAALGSVVAGVVIYARHRRARQFGMIDPDRAAVTKAGLVATAKAAGTGVLAAAGIATLAGTEQLLAHGVKRLVQTRLRRYDIGSPLVGHAVSLGLISAAGIAGYSVVKRRIERRGDVVEPAYPRAPLSPYVTAGPRSVVSFDDIGKEGRRFVLMALSAEEISAVMGEPAKDPVRVVAGYESAKDTRKRAEVCLREMEAVGAFERGVICIASPTGVGYVSYTFAESLEYLARGDCAIIVPEYALVPSALALFDTHDGVDLQRLVLQLCRDRIRQLPADQRPKLVQFGESLGAQVALDVADGKGAGEYDALGLDAGLYFGVPFRTQAWIEWRNDPTAFDPAGEMVLVSQPNRLLRLSPAQRASARQFMIVHHDDPVNKFSYRLIVARPWWLGAPRTRPPKVPREILFRPVTTFILTLLDLKNGMNFKPGVFVRRGHDYRIDSREAVIEAFGLPCSVDQAESIEAALREREEEWATRRLIARKFTAARETVMRTLRQWGVSVPTETDLEVPAIAKARGGPGGDGGTDPGAAAA